MVVEDTLVLGKTIREYIDCFLLKTLATFYEFQLGLERAKATMVGLLRCQDSRSEKKAAQVEMR